MYEVRRGATLLLLTQVAKILIHMSHMVMDQINYNWTSTQKITTEGSPVEHGKWIHGERKTPIQGNYFRPCTGAISGHP